MDDKPNSILLVEDDVTLRFLKRSQLERLGLSADEAQNGEVAVQKFCDRHYRLILMDVMMPVMDGLEATRVIRAEESKLQRERVTIIGMTAYTDKSGCLEAGMDAFIFKPVLLDALKLVLTKWLPGTVLKEIDTDHLSL